MTRWRKLASLTLLDLRLLVEATTCILLADLALRILPFRLIIQPSPWKKPSLMFGHIPPEEQLWRILTMADPHIPGHSSCLRRAVALTFFFRRYGILADLCIGVRREQKTVEAHAWVRTCGRVFGFSDEKGYTPLSPAPQNANVLTARL